MPTNGMVNDPRDKTPGVCRVCTNFDIVTDRARAVPYYDSESGDSASATSQKRNFLFANWLPGSTNDWRLFSLGVVSGTGRAEVLMRNTYTDASWSTPANNQSASGLTSYDLFVFYKKTGLIYGAAGFSSIWAFDAKTAGAWNDTSHSLTYSTVCQGLVHTQDDILYIGYDNKIASNNNGVWTDAALTLPSDLYITSLCEYGTYLAIAAAPISQQGKSRVYLWDRNSSIATVTANIDWGSGILQVLEELEGYLVGISSDSTNRNRPRVRFKVYAGAGGAKQFKVFTVASAVSTNGVSIRKQKEDNRVFFLMRLTLNGAVREGVWSLAHFGGGNFGVTHERTPNNNTALGAGSLTGFYFVSDYLFISYIDNAGTDQLSKTNDAASYTATSIIETIINPNMPPGDLVQKKKLLAVGAMYDPNPSGGQCVVKQKTNGASSYTTVFTETTTSAVKTEPVPVPSGGTYLTDGEELEFRIESTGGLVPTYLIYKYAVDESNT